MDKYGLALNALVSGFDVTGSQYQNRGNLEVENSRANPCG